MVNGTVERLEETNTNLGIWDLLVTYLPTYLPKHCWRAPSCARATTLKRTWQRDAGLFARCEKKKQDEDVEEEALICGPRTSWAASSKQ